VLWEVTVLKALALVMVIGAEVAFYFPFDVESFNGIEQRPEHPGSWSLLICLIFAAPACFFGRITRPRQPA
jgi:hypothetical protein